MESLNPSDLSHKELLAVARLKTVEECDQFVANVASNPKLVQAATKRSIEIQLASLTNVSQVVRDVWEVLYAYEEVLFIKHGKRLKAAYTRRAIENHGAIGAVERIVSQRSDDDDGFARLVAAGLPGMTFEAVVLRHAEHFSEQAIAQARAKLMVSL
jgi:hypothetical protein